MMRLMYYGHEVVKSFYVDMKLTRGNYMFIILISSIWEWVSSKHCQKQDNNDSRGFGIQNLHQLITTLGINQIQSTAMKELHWALKSDIRGKKTEETGGSLLA